MVRADADGGCVVVVGDLGCVSVWMVVVVVVMFVDLVDVEGFCI